MTRPAVAGSRSELATMLRDVRATGARVAFVPTMGALHEGHASLMARARREVGDGGRVVASIFVNPLQFGAGEDLDRYPRTLEADLEVCAREGVDVVLAPAVEEVYPGGVPSTGSGQRSTGSPTGAVTVDPGPLGEVLEGAVRPGHFRGVLTVVAKLFGLVQPDVAVFGEKDYQQLVLVRRMVADLCLPVEVVGAPTQREDDGLALSSRNRYLSPDERRTALLLNQALRAAVDAAPAGPTTAREAGLAVLRDTPGLDLDYLVLTDHDLAELPAYAAGPCEGRVLVAARVGTTRLIDNLPLTTTPGDS